MRQTLDSILAVLALAGLAGCGIGLQPGDLVPDDDDVAIPDDDDTASDDDDSSAGDDDDTVGDDDDTVGDDDDTVGDDDDSVGTGEGGACTAVSTLTCDTTVNGSTLGAGATDIIDLWDCTGWAETGPELAYSFTPSANGSVTVSLTSVQSGEDLDVYVTANSGIGCHSADCLASGDESATFDAFAGVEYFVVVDGYNGSAGDFVLDVACGGAGDDDDSVGDDDDSVAVELCANGFDDDGDGWTDCGDPDCASDPACAPPPTENCGNGFDDDSDGFVDCDDADCFSDPACAAAVEDCTNGFDDDVDGFVDCDDPDCSADPACGGGSGTGGTCVPDWSLFENSTDSWNNSGAGSTNLIDSYGCVNWDESGPEYTYEYIAAQTGTASVEVVPSAWFFPPDLDVFVLSGSTGSCEPTNCVAYGDTVATWAVTAGSVWYIVVDGYLGDSGDYDLTLSFSP